MQRVVARNELGFAERVERRGDRFDVIVKVVRFGIDVEQAGDDLARRLAFLQIGHRADAIVRIGRWPALFVVLALALALIYRYGPSREVPRWRWITWGSASASVLWLAASVLFSWYTANFGSYNATYGSLGAVIGFMTWLWISATVVLLGAELDVEMERQRSAIDGKAGASQPLAIR